LEECGPCPIFAGFTLAFAFQLRKKHGISYNKELCMDECMLIMSYYTSVNFGVSFAESQVFSENHNSTHLF
jgi:hypothetical protein